MALRIKRTIGTSVLFHAQHRQAKVAVVDVNGALVIFDVSNEKVSKRVRRTEGQDLKLAIRGHDVRVLVAEVDSRTVVLRIEAPPEVHILRDELEPVPNPHG